jgi:serine O-acetyltransferase
MKTPSFKLSLSRDNLRRYIGRQLDHLFPDGKTVTLSLKKQLPAALDRLEACFLQIPLKYYRDGQAAAFNHLNTDHYAMFLYLLSHMIYKQEGDSPTASKLYALNKALHGLDAFYQIELPEVFLFQHPVGTVLGRATYGNFLLVYQGCTVGSSIDQGYPTFGEGVVLYSGSSVLGSSRVGDNCWISTGSRVLNAQIPAHSLVFGASPDLIIKPTERQVIRDIFQKDATCAVSKN